MFERIKAWYLAGKWGAEQVQAAAAKGWISTEQADEILAAPEQ